MNMEMDERSSIDPARVLKILKMAETWLQNETTQNLRKLKTIEFDPFMGVFNSTYINFFRSTFYCITLPTKNLPTPTDVVHKCWMNRNPENCFDKCFPLEGSIYTYFVPIISDEKEFYGLVVVESGTIHCFDDGQGTIYDQIKGQRGLRRIIHYPIDGNAWSALHVAKEMRISILKKQNLSSISFADFNETKSWSKAFQIMKRKLSICKNEMNAILNERDENKWDIHKVANALIMCAESLSFTDNSFTAEQQSAFKSYFLDPSCTTTIGTFRNNIFHRKEVNKDILSCGDLLSCWQKSGQKLEKREILDIFLTVVNDLISYLNIPDPKEQLSEKPGNNLVSVKIKIIPTISYDKAYVKTFFAKIISETLKTKDLDSFLFDFTVNVVPLMNSELLHNKQVWGIKELRNKLIHAFYEFKDLKLREFEFFDFVMKTAVKFFLYNLSGDLWQTITNIGYLDDIEIVKSNIVDVVNKALVEKSIEGLHNFRQKVASLSKLENLLGGNLEETIQNLEDFIYTVVHFEKELMLYAEDGLRITPDDYLQIFRVFKLIGVNSYLEEGQLDIIACLKPKFGSDVKVQKILDNWKDKKKGSNEYFKGCVKSMAEVVGRMQGNKRQSSGYRHLTEDKEIEIPGTTHFEKESTIISNFLKMGSLSLDMDQLKYDTIKNPSSIFFNEGFLEFLVSHGNPFGNKTNVQCNILIKKLLKIQEMLPLIAMLASRCDDFRKQLQSFTHAKILKSLVKYKEPPIDSDIFFSFIHPNLLGKKSKSKPKTVNIEVLKYLWEAMVVDPSFIDSTVVNSLYTDIDLQQEFIKIIVENIKFGKKVKPQELVSAKRFLEKLVDVAIITLYKKGEKSYDKFRTVLHWDLGFHELEVVKNLITLGQVKLTDQFIIQAERLPTISLIKEKKIGGDRLFHLTSCKTRIVELLYRFAFVSDQKPGIYYILLSDLAYVNNELGEWGESENIYRRLFFELTSFEVENIPEDIWKVVIEGTLCKEIDEIHPFYANLSKIAKDIAYASSQFGHRLHFRPNVTLTNDQIDDKLTKFQSSITIYKKLLAMKDKYKHYVWGGYTTKLEVDLANVCERAANLVKLRPEGKYSSSEEMSFLLIQTDSLVKEISIDQKKVPYELQTYCRKNKKSLALCISRICILIETYDTNKLVNQDNRGYLLGIVNKLENCMKGN